MIPNRNMKEALNFATQWIHEHQHHLPLNDPDRCLNLLQFIVTTKLQVSPYKPGERIPLTPEQWHTLTHEIQTGDGPPNPR